MFLFFAETFSILDVNLYRNVNNSRFMLKMKTSNMMNIKGTRITSKYEIAVSVPRF